MPLSVHQAGPHTGRSPSAGPFGAAARQPQVITTTALLAGDGSQRAVDELRDDGCDPSGVPVPHLRPMTATSGSTPTPEAARSPSARQPTSRTRPNPTERHRCIRCGTTAARKRAAARCALPGVLEQGVQRRTDHRDLRRLSIAPNAIGADSRLTNLQALGRARPVEVSPPPDSLLFLPLTYLSCPSRKPGAWYGGSEVACRS